MEVPDSSPQTRRAGSSGLLSGRRFSSSIDQTTELPSEVSAGGGGGVDVGLGGGEGRRMLPRRDTVRITESPAEIWQMATMACMGNGHALS